MNNKKTQLIIVIIVYLILLFSGTTEDVGQATELYIHDYDLLQYFDIEDAQGSVDEVVEVVEVDKQYNEDDLYWLSRIISAEARGESIKGKIAVGNVVMNRVKSDKFPNSIKEVIFQKGQFCPVRNGSIYKEPTEESLEVAKMVLDGETVIGDDAVYFYAPKYTSRGNWIRTRKVTDVIGTHNFAR